jgi:hypothetical protein
VFPKASIFFLYSENKEYNFLFKILELIKKTNISYSTNIKKDISTIVVNSRIYAHTQTFDNMIGIDVGKLFFEDGYEEEIEKKLSKQLNKEIILDRNVLEKYKKTNRDIIEKYMEISNIHGLSCEEIVQTILGNFFIDERNYMDDEKFKFLLKKWNLLI